ARDRDDADVIALHELRRQATGALANDGHAPYVHRRFSRRHLTHGAPHPAPPTGAAPARWDAPGGRSSSTRQNLCERSTSCTTSTTWLLNGVGRPRRRPRRTISPFRKSTSLGRPRTMLCQVDPRTGNLLSRLRPLAAITCSAARSGSTASTAVIVACNRAISAACGACRSARGVSP